MQRSESATPFSYPSLLSSRLTTASSALSRLRSTRGTTKQRMELMNVLGEHILSLRICQSLQSQMGASNVEVVIFHIFQFEVKR